MSNQRGTFQHAGLEIAYREWGAGEPVVLLHGSLGSGAMWADLANGLKEKHRVIAPDLIGYGGSEPWPWPDTFALAHEVAAIEDLIERRVSSEDASTKVDEAVHIVGYSYGGAVALELARTRGNRVRSMVLIEPVAFDVLRQCGDRSAHEEAAGVRRAVIADLDRLGPVPAIRRFLAYWTGLSADDELPPAVASDPEAAVHKALLDFQVAFAGPRPASELTNLDVPTSVLSGTDSPLAMRSLCRHLAELLPSAEHRVVDRAGHLLPLTHGALVERAVRRNINCPPGRPCRCAA